VTGNEKYDRLLAAADPENVASMRVLEKAGFEKGEYKVGFYERG
jgi:ribosomal-protein-alanine N-acetyltransferase